MAAASSLGEQNLQAVGVPGPDFLHMPQGAQFCGTQEILLAQEN
jgi:hypothetical protein